jgi:hypothetical protein
MDTLFAFCSNYVIFLWLFKKQKGPIVYQLGHKIFNLGSRVRLPVGSQRPPRYYDAYLFKTYLYTRPRGNCDT